MELLDAQGGDNFLQKKYLFYMTQVKQPAGYC